MKRPAKNHALKVFRKIAGKCTAAAVAVTLLFGNAAGITAHAEEAAGKYPVKWDLTKIYKSEKDWQKDYEKALSLVPSLGQYRGRLSTAQGLYDFYEEYYNGELARLESKLTLYQDLGSQLDPSDKTFGELGSRLSILEQQKAEAVAYVEDEIFSMPIEERSELVSDPLLAKYAYVNEYLVDPDYVHFSEETSTALSKLSPAIGNAESIYEILSYVELPDPVLQLPDGTTQVLTDELYYEIMYGDEYGIEMKKLAYSQNLAQPQPYINTFAALLEDCMKSYWATAQLSGYDSTLEAALDAGDVEPEIYDMLIDAAHKAAPDYERYFNAHKKALGLDVQYPFDMAASVSDTQDFEVSYDDAIDDVRNALSILGEDYIASYDEIVNSPNLDVYPAPNKATGAFSVMMGDEYLPYMLFNYGGNASEISTFAHEIGHSVYSLWASRSQEPVYSNPTIFTQEVASTTNELLYYSYKIDNAANDDEKLFYLEQLLTMFGNTFFNQVMYAEFEEYCYQTIEQGGTLDADTLNEYFWQLNKLYTGDSIEWPETIKYEWAMIPHLYYNYYVYQYATSVAYASIIAQKIMSGEPGAVEAYKAFLKSGNSASPSELLRTAGADPLNAQTYDQATEYFKDLVDQYEELIERRAAQDGMQQKAA